jgi:LuxR family maltose regulon positive regulatory protein
VNGYMSVREAAERWNITVRQVQKLCSEGRIDGVTRFSNTWAIPEGASKPTRTVPVKPGPKPQKDTKI